jgi:predicted metal-dependent peptidase
MSEFAKTAGVLTKVRIQLLTRSVFLATILLSLKTRIGRDDVPTAGVNSTTLAVNPDFFDPLTFEQQIGLIAHEAWHLAFNHAGRRGDRDPYIWNAAGDFVINFLLVSTGFQIPEGGCYDPQYAGMSTEEVYELLRQNPQRIPQTFVVDMMPEDQNGKGGAKGNQQEIKAAIDQILVKAKVASELAGEKAGNIPGEILRYIEELLNPILPWYEYLYRYLSQFVKQDYSWTRPNRRYDEYLPSQRSPTIGKIQIAIDTSGSITKEMLKEILSEIQNIRDTFTPDELEILDCDWVIHNKFTIDSQTNLLDLEFTGGGGTSFLPVINYCQETKPEVLIYFTDLEAEHITEEPGFPTLWVCYDKHKPQGIGETIYYNRDDYYSSHR